MAPIGMIPRLILNMFSQPMTVNFPNESIPIPEDYRGEHEYDIDRCISCGLCARICPNRAIEMVEAPKSRKDSYPKTYPKIDMGKCCFCGLCQDICPKDALKLTNNVFLSTFDSLTVIINPIEDKKE